MVRSCISAPGWACWSGLILSRIYLQSSANREIAGAALNFLKVFGTSTPILSSTKFVVSIVKSCMRTAGNHNRAKINLLERMGHGLMSGYTVLGALLYSLVWSSWLNYEDEEWGQVVMARE